MQFVAVTYFEHNGVLMNIEIGENLAFAIGIVAFAAMMSWIAWAFKDD